MRKLNKSSLNRSHINDIRLAGMTLKYCNDDPRKAETVFGRGRKTIEKGPGGKRTGIICLGAQSAHSGRTRWEERETEAAEELRRPADAHSQQDPTFRSTLTHTRLTAKTALNALREKGFTDDQLPSPSGMADILNRMGYRLRKAVKAGPAKKIKETDAIFENLKARDQVGNAGNVKRLSTDCEAVVKIGDFSRGGQTRGDDRACDHDFGCKEKYVPCGISDEDSGQLHICFGNSRRTGDFIAGTLGNWWSGTDINEKQAVSSVQLKTDNGPESSGVRTQFLSRMVNFSDEIGKPVRLLHHPPCHSKYDPAERCRGVPEMHRNGAKLTDAETMLRRAGSMTWKGLSPVIRLTDKIYEKGIPLTESAMSSAEKFLKRNPQLPKWDILINPQMVS